MWYRIFRKDILKETEQELKQHEKQIADQMEVKCLGHFVDN